jgi:hypothetical protein
MLTIKSSIFEFIGYKPFRKGGWKVILVEDEEPQIFR